LSANEQNANLDSFLAVSIVSNFVPV